MARRLVYTTAFDGYDYVFPPIGKTTDCEFLLFTDNPDLTVSGWITKFVDTASFPTSRAANRYYKSCIADIVDGYDTSLYIDANIRVLGPLDQLFDQFEGAEAGLGVYRHPERHTVAEEIAYCQSAGKVADTASVERERAYQRDAGFKDNVGLIEATIMFKAHQDAQMRSAMQLWNDIFQQFGTRDQFSLPFAVWKSGVRLWFQSHNFRHKNRWFALYPHRKAVGVNPRYAYVSGRSHDSVIYKTLLLLWHGQWSIKRLLRKACGNG